MGILSKDASRERARTVLEQDRMEYAILQGLLTAITSADKTAPGFKQLGLSRMIAIRESLNRDYGYDPLRLTDWSKMATMLPAVGFDDIKQKFNDREWVVEHLQESRKRFEALTAAGRYPMSRIDPSIVSLLGSSGSSVLKPVIATNYGSLREVEDGTTVRLLDSHGNYIATSEITETGGSIVSLDDSVAEVFPKDSGAIDEADFIDNKDSFEFMGWSGGVHDNKELPGISRILGAYLTPADAKIVSRQMDDHLISGDTAYNTLAMLKHLRSEGIDFNVSDSERKNQIEVSLNDPDRTKVRVYDEQVQWIGRVYNSANSYYNIQAQVKGQAREVTWDVNDALGTIDYITGRRGGKLIKAKTKDTSRVMLDGADKSKWLHIKPHEGRYDHLVFTNAEESEAFIRDTIAVVRDYTEMEFEKEAIIEAIQAAYDTGTVETELDSVLDAILSGHDDVRDMQTAYIDDLKMIYDARANGFLEHIDNIELQSSSARLDAFSSTIDEDVYLAAINEVVGSYDLGFNPAFIIDNAGESNRRNVREAMMAALKTSKYDMSKLHGNDFSTSTIKDRLLAFDPETGKTIDEVENPMLRQAMEQVRTSLLDSGLIGSTDRNNPDVLIDDNGVILWKASRNIGTSVHKPNYQEISGEIGQIIVPDGNGIIHTKFAGGQNYGLVPAYTGYFTFDGEYTDNRMDRFRVKGFEQALREQIDMQLRKQISRPYMDVLQNIPQILDTTSLNGLYHGDVYGKRVPSDFVESSELSEETTMAILKTLSSRIRFENQYSEYATTSAETRNEQSNSHESQDTGEFSYWKVAGETNMRRLDSDLINYVDMTMTGTGKTQGLIWYLTDGSTVNDDGSVTPSEGVFNEKGERVPDSTAVQKLDYFKYKDNNAWDRNQMASNQLMTALKVDEKVGTALMAFGGWTFDDSYAVSLEFAKRNSVLGQTLNQALLDDLTKMFESDHANEPGADLVELFEKHSDADVTFSQKMLERAVGLNYDEGMEYLEQLAHMRPLQRGDKLSDFGGNKGTIGYVFDRNMSEAEAKAEKIEHEIAILKANPGLDVVSAPYSMLSRHNAGVVKEMMENSDAVQDIYDPVTGETYKGALGQLNIIVTDLLVDHKTHAYSESDVANGKGRKASGQLAWALQSKGATKILDEIYGTNVGPWSTLREYAITTGLDIAADGTLREGYEPQAGELRNTFEYDPSVDGVGFLNQIKSKGGFLNLPEGMEVTFKNGLKTTELPILSASLRRDTELIDGKMRRSDLTNYYLDIHKAAGDYVKAENHMTRKGKERVPADDSFKDDLRAKAQERMQIAFDKIQSEIIDRQFNGSHNGKHSFIRDKIMGKRLSNSATAVAIVDPRLNIGEVTMNSEMMDALSAKDGDNLMTWRDPALRDGAVRSNRAFLDESVYGIAMNPIADKSHDMDFDGDTMGVGKQHTKAAIKELHEKFSHARNMIDWGSGKETLYFQSGMDLASAEAQAIKMGRTDVEGWRDRINEKALSNDPKVQDEACKELNEYSHVMFREYGYGGAYVDLTNDNTVVASFDNMVQQGAKGSPKHLEEYKDYHFGKKTLKDAQDIQYATGVKSDDTGLAGGFSQKLVAALRNQDIRAALESSYGITQGTLQIKHDAKKAVIINNALTYDLNNVYGGKSADGKQKTLTKNGWLRQMDKVLGETLDVSYNTEFMESIANALVDPTKDQMRSLKEVAYTDGAAMDIIAYGGGYDAMVKLAKDGRSLLEGEQSKMFAPRKMREATADTVLAKADSLDKSWEEDIAASLNEAMAPIVQDFNYGETASVRREIERVQKEVVDEGPDL